MEDTAISRLTVGKSTVRAIMEDQGFPELVAEYAREAAIEGMPAPDARMPVYLHLEALGALHAFSAVLGNSLVGFISLLAPILPHYGATVAVSESFFVASAHRKSGAGMRLLHAAEVLAAELGSPGLLVSAPFAGRLATLLPRCGYVQTSSVFFKKGDASKWAN